MKVVFCTNDGKNIINGVNTWLLRLLPALKENDINVNVIYTAWVAEDECTLVPLLKEKGISCSKINSLGYTEREVKWILSYVKATQPDIFVANNMVPAFYASKWLQKAGIPTIIVLNNDGDEATAVIKRFVAVPGDFRATAVVAVSTHLEQKVMPHHNSVLVRKIPYGVSVNHIRPVYDLTQTFKICYVGRLSQDQKKIGDVVDAFCRAALSFPDMEAYIYGSGPDVAIVHQTLKNYGNPKNVFIKGNIDNKLMQKELLQMHVVTLMSDFEGLPLALLEAMGCGLVPVCKKIESGIPELIQEHITGLFVNNTDDYAGQIKYLKQNPDVYNRLSANAYNLIKNNFSDEKNVDEWLSLFNDVCPPSTKKVDVPFFISLPYVNDQMYGENREPHLVLKAYKKIKRCRSAISLKAKQAYNTLLKRRF